MPDRVIKTNSSDETFKLGQKLGKDILDHNRGVKVGLSGELGAGKTLLIKGIMSTLMPEVDVTSPSYTLINEFNKDGRKIMHVDLYRIYNTDELFGTDFLEALSDPDTIMFIEWVDHIKDQKKYFDDGFCFIDIKYLSDDSREITIRNWRTKK